MKRLLHLLVPSLVLLSCAGRGEPPEGQADFVVVDKSERRLTLYREGRPLKTYTGIQLGGAPAGGKQFEGDQRTPEGRYTIDGHKPDSAYHLALHLSYPDEADTAFAARYGRSPGGAIFIHGQPNSLPFGRVPGDWTAGCIAVSDSEIEELWQTIPDGTPIEIRP
ncbi:MAG: L,D-transpeptidase family protein [Novosphingobium sp.]|nr:L,D-transpeptidase family protein [Novosphingobium sp.]MBO9601431.1 L,D-transpeptidase family protein [Novosphingobium sp.]